MRLVEAASPPSTDGLQSQGRVVVQALCHADVAMIGDHLNCFSTTKETSIPSRCTGVQATMPDRSLDGLQVERPGGGMTCAQKRREENIGFFGRTWDFRASQPLACLACSFPGLGGGR